MLILITVIKYNSRFAFGILKPKEVLEASTPLVR